MTVMRTSRHLNAKPDAVFAAVQDPSRLARWWGPDGFSNTFDSFEFKPGGRWQFTMHGPDGKSYPNLSEFLQIVPNALVRIKHLSAPHFVLTIELSASNDGTLVLWHQEFDDPKVAESLRHIIEPANEQNLDRLAREVSGGSA